MQTTTRQEELQAIMKANRIDSSEYQAALKESNKLYDARQRELRAERKAIKEQMKALKERLEELNEQIW